MDVSTALAFTTHAAFVSVLAQAGLSHSQVLLLIVVLGVSATMVIAARRHRRRDANSPRAYAREQVARLREEAGVKDDLEALLVQVHDLTRQMNAQLDTKFYKLERAIRDADEHIHRLDRLVRVAEGRSVCDVTIGAEGDESPGPPRDHTADAAEHRHAQVYRLSDAGLSPMEIADQTNQTVGEIELILALRPRSGTPSPG